jgi:chemotaxis protein MotB
MSVNEPSDVGAREIVIVRRRANHEDDGHHGGAWKIAFADFMTAMMAFFLVMWLINSTDKKTLTQVATYFNPIRLSDRSASPRGVFELDPMAKPQKSSSRKSEDKKPESEPLQDDQVFSQTLRQDRNSSPSKSTVAPMRPHGTATAQAETGPRDPFERIVPRIPEGPSTSDVTNERSVDQRATTAARMRAALHTELGQLGLETAFNLDVIVTSEGVLVRITEPNENSLFEIGSAVAGAELALAMRVLGPLLARERGAVLVAGHTDARTYRSTSYDNWRLSTSRAHAAKDLLERGGLANSRIARISGHSDREPIDPDPMSPRNRRIEILLRVEP